MIAQLSVGSKVLYKGKEDKLSVLQSRNKWQSKLYINPASNAGSVFYKLSNAVSLDIQENFSES